MAAPPPSGGMPPPSSGFGVASADPGMYGTKVVETQHYDGPMNTHSAEHQKVTTAGYGENVHFSSPFGFSGGEGPPPAAVPPPAAIPPSSTTYFIQYFEPPPPYVDGCFGIYHQTQETVLVGQQAGHTTQVARYEMSAPAAPIPMKPIIEGYLAKRGEEFGKPWLKRWFRLMPGPVLTYGKEQKNCTEKDVSLLPQTVVRPLSSPEVTNEGRIMGTKKPFGFEIFTGGGTRTWFIDAGSAEKLRAWLWALNAALHQLRSGPPPGPGGPPRW